MNVVLQRFFFFLKRVIMYFLHSSVISKVDTEITHSFELKMK